MPKQSVVVNGVTLSRNTIEKAYEELNAPEPNLFSIGDIVRSRVTGLQGVVVDIAEMPPSTLAKQLRGPGSLPSGWVRVVLLSGRSTESNPWTTFALSTPYRVA